MSEANALGFISWGLWGEGGSVVQIIADIGLEIITSPEAISIAFDPGEITLTIEADEITVEID